MLTAADLSVTDPQPGIYAGVPMGVYVLVNAVNHSTLDKGLLSMAHMKAALDRPERSTAATEYGTACHAAIFEPEKYKAMIAPAPINKSTRKPYGRDAAAWREYAQGFPEGTLILTCDELDEIETICRKVLGHPQAGRLVAAPGPCEAVAIWKDEETGLLVKGRLDKFVPGIVALDYKTTRCAEPESFGRDAAKYGYARQVALYIDGFKAASGQDTDYIIVAQETSDPYEVMVYRLDDAAVIAGQTQNRRLLREYAKAKATGIWPGYEPGVHTLELPKYATKIDPGGLDKPTELDDDPFATRENTEPLFGA